MNDLPESERAKLTEWVLVAFDEAVRAGYVTPPWRPSDAMYDRMAGYYRVGLTPWEAAQAAFAVRH